MTAKRIAFDADGRLMVRDVAPEGALTPLRPVPQTIADAQPPARKHSMHRALWVTAKGRAYLKGLEANSENNANA